MTKTITMLVFTLGAVVVPAAFEPAQAHAYSINLECSPPGATNPTWAGTNNTVTVKSVKKNGSKVTLVSRAITQSDCYTFFNVTQGFDNNDVLGNVVRFEITISGTDTFWIDRAWAQEGGNFLNWEVDDHVGFCVRNSAFSSANCVQGQAFSQWNLTTGN